MGVLGEHWRFLTENLEHSGAGKTNLSAKSDDLILPERRYPENFIIHIFITSVSRTGGPLSGYLKEIGGSWLEIWRIGSSIMSLMIPFYPKEDVLKVFLFIPALDVRQEWYLPYLGTWRTFRVPEGRHGGQGHSWRHELCSFNPWKITWKFCVDISIRSVPGRGILGGHLGFLTRDMDERVIPDAMNYVLIPLVR